MREWNERRVSIWLIIAANLFVLAVYLFQNWQILARSDLLSDDYRQNLFWVPSLARPTLFQGDPIAEYMRDFNPPGLVWLYRAAVCAGLDPLLFSKLVSLLLFCVFLAGVVSLGRAMCAATDGADVGALTAGLLLLFVLLNNQYYWERCVGGLARNFAFPFQAWFLAAIARRRMRSALAVSAIASLFHPQTFMITITSLAIIHGWAVLRSFQGDGSLRRSAIGLALTCLAGALLALPWMHKSRLMREKYGQPVNWKYVLSQPEYAIGGRWEEERPLGFWLNLVQETRADWPLKSDGTIRMNTQHRSAILIYLSFLFWAGWSLIHDRQWLGRTAGLSVALAVALFYFALAYLLFPHLYFPNRFLRPVVPLLVTAFLARRLALGPPTGCTRSKRRIWWTWAIALLAAEVFLFDSDRNMGYDVDASRLASVAAYVRQLPDDALIAAYPRSDADSLAVLGQRSVYVQREATHPLFLGYYAEIRQRTWRTLRGLFPLAGDADVAPLARDGVRYVLINKRLQDDLCEKGAIPKYDEPFETWMRDHLSIQAGEKIHRYWFQERGAWICYEDDHYALVSIADLAGSPAAQASPASKTDRE